MTRTTRLTALLGGAALIGSFAVNLPANADDGALDTRITANDASFDEYGDGAFTALFEADVDTGVGEDWQPVAGAYVIAWLDTNGHTNGTEGYERAQCAGFTDANGLFSCNPSGGFVPALSSSERSWLADFEGTDAYQPSADSATATYAGLLEADEQSSATACGSWSTHRVDVDEDGEEHEVDNSYYVCADRFDDDGDGSDDRAGVSVTRLGDDGFAQWNSEVDLSDVVIDVAGGTASIDATIDGVSDATTGTTCDVAMSFTASGPAEAYGDSDLNAGFDPDTGKVSLTRSYWGVERDAVANGTACGLAEIGGIDSTDATLTTYHDSTDTITL